VKTSYFKATSLRFAHLLLIALKLVIKARLAKRCFTNKWR